MVGLAYGSLPQFIQELLLSFSRCAATNVLAFAALGWRTLQKAAMDCENYIAALLIARGAFHALSGYLYWMSYVLEEFPPVSESSVIDCFITSGFSAGRERSDR